MKNYAQFGLLLSLTVVLPSTPAFAYIDANSISLTVQALIGGVATAIMFGKIYLGKVLSIFRRGNQDRDAENSRAD